MTTTERLCRSSMYIDAGIVQHHGDREVRCGKPHGHAGSHAEYDQDGAEIAAWLPAPGPSVSGQPTPKIVSGEYDDAAAQHDALVRAAEQARAENARLRQERNEARRQLAARNKRHEIDVSVVGGGRLVADVAARIRAIRASVGEDLKRIIIERENLRVQLFAAEERYQQLAAAVESAYKIAKDHYPWPLAGRIGAALRDALAATAPQTAPTEDKIDGEEVSPCCPGMAHSKDTHHVVFGEPTPADPGPDVDAFVNTPAGRAWLAGAAGREALRPAPTENTREQILARLAQPTPADQGAALIAATEAELDEYTEGHLCAQAWREAAHTLAAALDRRADQGVVRETGEAGDFVRLAFGLRQRSITWDGDVIQAALHTIDDLRAARTAGDDHLQALRVGLREQGYLNITSDTAMVPWVLAEVSSLRARLGQAEDVRDEARAEARQHRADTREAADVIREILKPRHNESIGDAAVRLASEHAEARREAERLRGEIGKVADDFGVKAVRLTGTTDPLDRVAFALCDDVAERLRALASTGGSDTTGGGS